LPLEGGLPGAVLPVNSSVLHSRGIKRAKTIGLEGPLATMLARLFALAVLLPAVLEGQSRERMAHSLVRAYMSENVVPGLGLAVGAGREEIYSAAFGFSDLEAKSPVGPERTWSGPRRIPRSGRGFGSLGT